MNTLKGLIYLILILTILYLSDDLGRVFICIAFLLGIGMNSIFEEKEN